MASGGHDNEPDVYCEDGAGSRPTTEEEQLPPRTMNIHVNSIQHAQMAANNMSVQAVVVNMNPFPSQPRQRRHDPDDQALLPIPPPEDLSHLFRPDDLDRDLQDIFLSKVAISCDSNVNWRKLALKMKLGRPTVEQLKMNYETDIREFIYQLLLRWKRCNEQRKVRDLIRVLSESKLEGPAMALSHYLCSIHD